MLITCTLHAFSCKISFRYAKMLNLIKIIDCYLRIIDIRVYIYIYRFDYTTRYNNTSI